MFTVHIQYRRNGSTPPMAYIVKLKAENWPDAYAEVARIHAEIADPAIHRVSILEVEHWGHGYVTDEERTISELRRRNDLLESESARRE